MGPPNEFRIYRDAEGRPYRVRCVGSVDITATTRLFIDELYRRMLFGEQWNDLLTTYWSKYLGVCDRTVYRCLKRLKQVGWIGSFSGERGARILHFADGFPLPAPKEERARRGGRGETSPPEEPSTAPPLATLDAADVEECAALVEEAECEGVILMPAANGKLMSANGLKIQSESLRARLDKNANKLVAYLRRRRPQRE